MTLNLVRRSTKGSPLTAVDHDGNLDKLEQAIEGIEPIPGTDLSYTPSTRLLSSSTGQDVTLPLAGTDAGLLAGVSFTGPSGWTASGSVANGTITLSLALPAGSSLVASGDRTAWDTAYAERLRWDGGSTGLNASTARTSLGLGTAATTDASAYVQTNDARLTDSREWSADTISQNEAETGTGTTRRAFTAQRVRQAIAAWWSTITTISLPAGSAPSTPATGFALFANASNALSWIGANGFTRTFDGTANTANRTYTLPNASGTVALTSDIPAAPGVVTTSAAGLARATGYGSISYAAQVTLDFSALTGQMNTISLTGALELLTSNLAAGREVRLRLVCDSTQRTLTFPADWKFVGTKPANIAASKVAVLSLAAFGTTNADVVAAFAVQS